MAQFVKSPVSTTLPKVGVGHEIEKCKTKLAVVLAAQ